MNSYERMTRFLRGVPVDRVPFMPILMRFCAQYTGTKYRDFILDPEAHCRSNIACADAFSSDWVNVMSDPYGELEAYGASIEYPEDSLPLDRIVLFQDARDLARLPRLDIEAHPRLRGRLEELRVFRRELGKSQVICGWIEGPLAEYCDLRSLANACYDLYDHQAEMADAMTIIHDNARNFATLQIQAGANMVGIGDSACSQIGPDFYRQYGFPHEKRLVEHIHSLGALAKLHICGNTSAILPDMIRTGADIIDVDHLVRDMSPYPALLEPHQVLCGNLDPVSVLENGGQEDIVRQAREAWRQARGRLILSGGCEITPGTPPENLAALAECCRQVTA
ncbi:MAG: uroporphyrinogen decarboxylase family protein [Lentisphaeria bacterium]|nr:uroporphyrinogen decarboxylase family protein [Lentisphaeria bacterium]